MLPLPRPPRSLQELGRGILQPLAGPCTFAVPYLADEAQGLQLAGVGAAAHLPRQDVGPDGGHNVGK